jgi:hypothetical protein
MGEGGLPMRAGKRLALPVLGFVVSIVVASAYAAATTAFA